MKTRISLRVKFSAILTGIILLLGISIIWFIKTSVCNHLTTEMQKRAEFIARDVAFESIDPILTMDVYALQSMTLDHTGLHEDILYVFITGPDGNILAHSFGAKFPADLMKPSIVANVGAGRTTRLETNKGVVFDVSSPVLRGRAGAVHVGILGEPMEAKVTAILWEIIGIIAGILVLGYILAMYFVSFIVKPIRELTHVAEALGEGDLTQRAQVAAHDETGVLADAFNEMAEDLMRTTTSITNLNVEIAARKQVEGVLRESEERFRSLIGNIPGVVYRCQTTYPWPVEHVSEAVFEITGYHAEDLMEGRIQGIGTLIFPEDVENVKRLVAAGVAGHRPFELKYRIQHAAGGIRWVHEKGQAVCDADGTPLWLDGVILDVTEGRLVEEALKKSEARYRSLTDDVLDSSELGLFILDADFAVVWINKATERFFGVQRDQVIGKDKRELIRTQISSIFENPQEFMEKVIATYDNNTYVERFECHVLGDGTREERWLEHRSLPILSGLYAGGRMEHYIDITQRTLAERALQESENRFRDFFANAPIGFHIFGPNQIITDINDAELDMIGYTHDEIVGKKTWADLIIPAQAEQFKKHWNDIMTKGNVRNLEYTLVHKQGHHIDVLLNASSRFDEIGQFINSRGSILNITERKRTEEQVENLARFPSENPGPVLRIARDGTLLYANDASKSILEEWGCREGEAVPDEWRGIISGVFEAREEKKIEREYAGKVLSFMIVPVIETGYANLYCRDTTERKRAEEALKLRFDLEELLTSISTEFISLEPDEIDDGIERAMESIIDAVCVDRGNIFLYSTDGDTMDNTHEHCRPGVPPHKERLQDVPVERFPWFNARMKRFETVAVGSVASLTEEAEAEKEEWRYEGIQSLLCVPMVSRDRLMGFVGFDTVLYETQWAEEIVTFLKILGTVFANALERKRAGQERERLLKTLAAKNEELQSIVYVASHDLKSPLVNIQGFSGELSRACEQIDEVLHSEKVPTDIQKQLAPLLDEDIPESIGFIRAGTAKMQALLNGLLEVCRVGSAVLEIQALDMNEIMKYIVASMQYQITDSGAELTADDLPGCIGDPDHVNQVFSNLLANAVKYLDPDRKGRIHISGRVEDGESIYCVRDNGLGIAPQHQQRVFEIFHRLEPNGDVEGEGLGLTIALRILERHEGRIWVESEPGKGSKFFVSLPTA